MHYALLCQRMAHLEAPQTFLYLFITQSRPLKKRKKTFLKTLLGKGENVGNQGQYLPTILKNILGLFLQDW